MRLQLLSGLITATVLSLVLHGQASLQPFMLEGQIVTADAAAPIEGAVVSIRSGSRVIVVRSAVTDSSGLFRLPVQVGPAALSVVASGFETRSQRFTAKAGIDLDLRLQRAEPLRGVLRDVAARPVKDARVRLYPLEPGGLKPVLETQTKADGSYMIRGASQSGAYALQATVVNCPWTTLRVGSGHSLSALQVQQDIVVPCR